MAAEAAAFPRVVGEGLARRVFLRVVPPVAGIGNPSRPAASPRVRASRPAASPPRKTCSRREGASRPASRPAASPPRKTCSRREGASRPAASPRRKTCSRRVPASRPAASPRPRNRRPVASLRPRNRKPVASPPNRPTAKTGKAMGSRHSKVGKVMGSRRSKAGRTMRPTMIITLPAVAMAGLLRRLLRRLLSLHRWGLCGWGCHGRDHWFDDDGGRVQCAGLDVYEGDRERHNLLSLRVNVVSADDAREPGDVYRGKPAEVEGTRGRRALCTTPRRSARRCTSASRGSRAAGGYAERPTADLHPHAGCRHPGGCERHGTRHDHRR